MAADNNFNRINPGEFCVYGNNKGKPRRLCSTSLYNRDLVENARLAGFSMEASFYRKINEICNPNEL